jgi:hypothetical protein
VDLGRANFDPLSAGIDRRAIVVNVALDLREGEGIDVRGVESGLRRLDSDIGIRGAGRSMRRVGRDLGRKRLRRRGGDVVYRSRFVGKFRSEFVDRFVFCQNRSPHSAGEYADRQSNQ